MEEKELTEKIIQINRVSKKTKGGNKLGFSVLVVVGDKKGRVGIGLGRARDVPSAIRKAIEKAKRSFYTIPLKGTTIPHEVKIKRGAAKLLLKPAPPGAGLIAGGTVRAVVELAGVKDVSIKVLGTNNKLSNVYATLEALKKLKPVV